MKDMTVETLNFIILCMGLLFVMETVSVIVQVVSFRTTGKAFTAVSIFTS